MDYAVIMAGGTGKRLWPLSRAGRPKQVLRLIDGKSLLRLCFERILPSIPAQRILVLTNRQHVRLVREELSELSGSNVIGEPAVRDTCSAIALAATILNKLDAESSMAVVSADQFIAPVEAFQQVLADGLRLVNARPDCLVVFGIRPTFPSTQLGYIRLGQGQMVDGSTSTTYPVEAFKEKPDLATAKAYLASGKYMWNSGMFVWKARRILELIRRFLPEAAEPLDQIEQAWGGPGQADALEQAFPRLPRISIDYAVMEKARDVYALRLDCRWLDLGSFMALAGLFEKDTFGNVVAGACGQLLDCHNTIAVSEDNQHLIAGIGLEDMLIVHSQDATLVCPIAHADRLKELVERLEQRGATGYL